VSRQGASGNAAASDIYKGSAAEQDSVSSPQQLQSSASSPTLPKQINSSSSARKDAVFKPVPRSKVSDANFI